MWCWEALPCLVLNGCAGGRVESCRFAQGWLVADISNRRRQAATAQRPATAGYPLLRVHGESLAPPTAPSMGCDKADD